MMHSQRGGFNGGYNRGGFNNNRGRFNNNHGGYSGGNSDTVLLGTKSGTFNDFILMKCNGRDHVPFFNAYIYNHSKQQIGNVDDIIGPINDFMCSVKASAGIKSKSLPDGAELFVDSAKLLPISRFTESQPSRGRGASRGGRGQASQRGRGGSFGSHGRGGSFNARGRGGFRGRGTSRGRRF